MEDHLKNQDRLDEEWLSICAYEAEPCSTAIAEKNDNAKLNRPGASLPYDHSRIVLNDLANVNNSDYINASTIVSIFFFVINSSILIYVYENIFFRPITILEIQRILPLRA